MCLWKYFSKKINKKKSLIKTIQVEKIIGECPICLEDMCSKNLIAYPCSHVLHEKCAKQCLKISLNCPICQTPMNFL